MTIHQWYSDPINFQGESGLSRSFYYEWHSDGPIFLDLSFHKGRVHISAKTCPFIFFMICQHHLIKRRRASWCLKEESRRKSHAFTKAFGALVFLFTPLKALVSGQKSNNMWISPFSQPLQSLHEYRKPLREVSLFTARWGGGANRGA